MTEQQIFVLDRRPPAGTVGAVLGTHRRQRRQRRLENVGRIFDDLVVVVADLVEFSLREFSITFLKQKIGSSKTGETVLFAHLLIVSQKLCADTLIYKVRRCNLQASFG